MGSENEISFAEFNAAEFWRVLDTMRPPFFHRGLCRLEENKIFFPKRGRYSSAAKAKAICRTCAVRTDCFDYAYEKKLADGVWGGADRTDRRKWLKLGLTNFEAWEAMLTADARAELESQQPEKPAEPSA